MLTIHLAANDQSMLTVHHLPGLRAAYEAISSPQKSKLSGLTLPFWAAGT